jgi:hypothetical protein
VVFSVGNLTLYHNLFRRRIERTLLKSHYMRKRIEMKGWNWKTNSFVELNLKYLKRKEKKFKKKKWN